jgi:hypothetical protein
MARRFAPRRRRDPKEVAMSNPNDTAGLPPLSWNPEECAKSLDCVRDYVERQGRELLGWYFQKKIWKRRMSTALRVASILLFTLGGLIPLVKASWPGAPTSAAGLDFGQLGYLLIALGGAAIAFDRFFGYSSGWIRYITTEMAIERSIDEFRLDWARSIASLRGVGPTAEQVDQLMQLAKTFALSVRAQVEQETKAWVLEFQSNLSDLEKSLKARADEAKAEGAASKAAGAG